ncbi:hypothetical protein, partial [Streptomyces sp. NPDC003514]
MALSLFTRATTWATVPDGVSCAWGAAAALRDARVGAWVVGVAFSVFFADGEGVAFFEGLADADGDVEADADGDAEVLTGLGSTSSSGTAALAPRAADGSSRPVPGTESKYQSPPPATHAATTAPPTARLGGLKELVTDLGAIDAREVSSFPVGNGIVLRV